MSELIHTLSEMGADSGYNMTEEHNKVVRQFNEAKSDVMRLRLPKTAYKVGDKVIVPGVSNADIQLRCETAGTTAESEIPGGYNGLTVGQIINDGGVSWSVIYTVSIPDTPEAPVTSVNNKRGDVNLSAGDVGALPTTHNEAEDAHSNLFSAHRDEKASVSKLGHVMVDGDSIVIDNEGRIKAVGGRAIGDVFSHISAEPPEGAYLLNGQTIPDCKEKYKQFWAWVNEKANDGKIRFVTATKYEEEKKEYGFCGAFVIGDTSVRLPDFRKAFLMGGDSTNIGQSVKAGLPNITGSFSGVGQAFSGDANNVPYLTGAFALENETEHPTNGVKVNNSGEVDDVFNFDASRSNEAYGNSDTVQPPAVLVSFCIQVFNAATGLSTQESAQLASQMQMKAQVDFANVNENLDFVVESWNDGAGNWYRLYRSGWVEQGGVTPSIASNDTLTVTLYIEMRDVEFSTIVTNGGGASVNDNWDYGAIGGYATSTMTILVDRARGAGKAYWRVAGMARK